MILAPFPYQFQENYQSVTCVFKLRFGSKFFIFKGLKLHTTVSNLSAQINREMSRPKEDSILYKVIAYINRARITSMKVEVIHETDNIAELLMVEYEQLQKAKKNPNCLNTTFVNNEHYPHWMPQAAINEFTKQLHGVKMPDKHKNLKKMLSNHIKDPVVVEKVFEYVVLKFR